MIIIILRVIRIIMAGLMAGLFAGYLFEIFENSEFIINRFVRQVISRMLRNEMYNLIVM